MEDNRLTDQQKIDEAHTYAQYQLASNRKDPGTVRKELIEQGFDEQSAYNVVNNVMDNVQDQFRAARKSAAQKQMALGGIICGVGIALTIADIGYIFWGAIVFGGIRFFKGLSEYSN